MKTRVLYIEDEEDLGRIVCETLGKLGFEVVWVTDGSGVMQQLNDFGPHVCVLDIMLPNIDGYSLSRQITTLFPELPVIFLTAKTTTADLVKGFESGGSDYIRKPFSMEELVVRIRNQLSIRNNEILRTDLPESGIAFGKYLFKPLRYELHGPSGIKRLSQRDMQILSMLVASRNRLTDRKKLLLSVWGDDSFFNSRNLDVYIRKLRDLLKEDANVVIQTIKGKGYLFIVRN